MKNSSASECLYKSANVLLQECNLRKYACVTLCMLSYWMNVPRSIHLHLCICLYVSVFLYTCRYVYLMCTCLCQMCVRLSDAKETPLHGRGRPGVSTPPGRQRKAGIIYCPAAAQQSGRKGRARFILHRKWKEETNERKAERHVNNNLFDYKY